MSGEEGASNPTESHPTVLAIYFAAGLAGSVVSVWVHPQAVGAGASGAIFGLYNVVYGSMSGTTDLAAHIGGLVAGFLMAILVL